MAADTISDNDVLTSSECNVNDSNDDDAVKTTTAEDLIVDTMSIAKMDVGGVSGRDRASSVTSWPAFPALQEDAILAPFTYLSKVKGKEVRPLLLQAFNVWLDVPPKTLAVLQSVVQMLHTASLLIDDIQDNSKYRRGEKVAHEIFGVASTINAANYVYFLALEKVSSLGNASAVSVFVSLLLELHRGQGLDIHWRVSNECPSEQEYLAMVLRKTGGLFHLGAKLMRPFARQECPDLSPLLDALGAYYQVRDDYLNVTSDAYMKKKTFCEDLTEGKFSYPIVHAVRTHPTGGKELLSILKQHTEDESVLRRALCLIREQGSLEYTKATLIRMDESARKEIQLVGSNPLLEQLMTQLYEIWADDGIEPTKNNSSK